MTSSDKNKNPENARDVESEEEQCAPCASFDIWFFQREKMECLERERENGGKLFCYKEWVNIKFEKDKFSLKIKRKKDKNKKKKMGITYWAKNHCPL